MVENFTILSAVVSEPEPRIVPHPWCEGLGASVLTLHGPEGDVVICQHPEQDLEMVKRVVIIEEGRFFVQGDNKVRSSDSRQFGWLTREHIIGVVVSKLT